MKYSFYLALSDSHHILCNTKSGGIIWRNSGHLACHEDMSTIQTKKRVDISVLGNRDLGRGATIGGRSLFYLLQSFDAAFGDPHLGPVFQLQHNGVFTDAVDLPIDPGHCDNPTTGIKFLHEILMLLGLLALRPNHQEIPYAEK
jgi:hypothetical protein